MILPLHSIVITQPVTKHQPLFYGIIQENLAQRKYNSGGKFSDEKAWVWNQYFNEFSKYSDATGATPNALLDFLWLT